MSWMPVRSWKDGASRRIRPPIVCRSISQSYARRSLQFDGVISQIRARDAQSAQAQFSYEGTTQGYGSIGNSNGLFHRPHRPPRRPPDAFPRVPALASVRSPCAAGPGDGSRRGWAAARGSRSFIYHISASLGAIRSGPEPPGRYRLRASTPYRPSRSKRRKIYGKPSERQPTAVTRRRVACQTGPAGLRVGCPALGAQSTCRWESHAQRPRARPARGLRR
jgi:hypothetical protein